MQSGVNSREREIFPAVANFLALMQKKGSRGSSFPFHSPPTAALFWIRAEFPMSFLDAAATALARCPAVIAWRIPNLLLAPQESPAIDRQICLGSR